MRSLRASRLMLFALVAVVALPALAHPSRRLANGTEVAPEADFVRALPLDVPAPVYPPELEKEKVGGEVRVDCTVEVDGTVSKVIVLEATHKALGESVTAAAKGAKFRPATLEGRRVAVLHQLRFSFKP